MFEETLYQHLIASEELAQLLTTYQGKPAIFREEAPGDMDPGWADGPQYARLVYGVDMQGDPERKTSGTLSIDVFCAAGSFNPEDLEPIVRSLIDGYFFSDTAQTMAAIWERTDGFQVETGKGSNINGVTLTFSLSAYPAQETGAPDPVQRLNSWCKDEYPDAKIIGLDALPNVWKPTNTAPAVYWNLQQIGPGRIPDSWACTWRTATLRGFVMAPGEIARNGLVRSMADRLDELSRLIFPDNSPLMFQQITAKINADPLKEGQITVLGEYGITRKLPQRPTLNHIHMAHGKE